MSNEKIFKENNKINVKTNKGKNRDSGPLTYNLSDILDELYPQYKHKKKKEDNK